MSQREILTWLPTPPWPQQVHSSSVERAMIPPAAAATAAPPAGAAGWPKPHAATDQVNHPRSSCHA
jgi:hypothetical protein